VFPDTREQRCWFHVCSNVLAALPKSAHPGAKSALAEIYNAEDKAHAIKAVKAFEADYGARTTNPIEVDLRHRAAASAGHQGTRLAGHRNRDGVQVIESAQAR